MSEFALVFQFRVFRNTISLEKLKYVRLILALARKSLQIAENYKKIVLTNNYLERQNQLLSRQYEISRDFGVLLSKEEIISHLRFWIMGQLLVNKFAIFIKWLNGFYEVINRFDFPFEKNILKELFSIEKLHSSANFNKLSMNLESFSFENEIKVISPMIYQNMTSGILILRKRIDGM